MISSAKGKKKNQNVKKGKKVRMVLSSETFFSFFYLFFFFSLYLEDMRGVVKGGEKEIEK